MGLRYIFDKVVRKAYWFYDIREILLTYFLCISCIYTCTLTHDRKALYTRILYVYGIWKKVMALYTHHHLISWYKWWFCPQWLRWYDGMPLEAWWCYEHMYLCTTWHSYAYAWHYKYFMIYRVIQTYRLSHFLNVSFISFMYLFMFLTYSVHYSYRRPFIGDVAFMPVGIDNQFYEPS